MKLSVTLLFAAALHVSATGFAQKITLSEKDVPLKNVLADLRKLSHYDLIFTDEQLHNARVAELNVKDATLKDVLDQLLKGLPLTYVIDDNTIVIRDKVIIPPAQSSESWRKTAVTVAGVVEDQHHSPLSGATVATRHGKDITTTDVRGFFQLKNVEETDTLIISYIGYSTKRIGVGTVYGKLAFPTIRLEEATEGLDQVVVQGYGRTTQRLTTADIGKVTAAEIARQPVTDPLLAIEGKVAGVIVTPTSGYEGGVVKIEIRGRNSVNPGLPVDPLYVIDGVPLSTGGATSKPAYGSGTPGAYSTGLDQTGLSFSQGQSPIYNINPADIESIEILKDADATAIYGSRGANGVILITTKRGKAGTNVLDLNASEGINFSTRAWPLLNTKNYLAMRREALRNDGNIATIKTAPDLLLWDTTRYTDWQKFAYGGVSQATSAQGSLSGGNDQTTFRLGAGYDRSTSIARVSGANQRATIALNLSHSSIDKKLTISISANYAYGLQNQINLNGLANLPPDAPAPYDKQGRLNYVEWDKAKVNFPFASVLQPYSSHETGLTSNLTINYTILKGLRATVSMGYNNSVNNQTSITPLASLDPLDTTKKGSSSFGTSRSGNWIVEPQLNYGTLWGKSRFEMLLGATAQSSNTDGLVVNGSNYTSDIFIHNITGAPTVRSFDNNSQYKYAGAYTRLTYNYDNKYILNLNGRRDGSSRFGPSNRFGNFGSVGAAWIFSDEKWGRKLLPEAINFVKFRASYGTTGGDGVSDYQYLSQWGNATLPAYDGVVGLVPLIDDNPNFHWQVNKKLEGALQLEFFQSLLSVELAYYRNRCDNQLIGFPLPELTGFTSVTANSPANVQNSGFEATIIANPIRNAKFRWSLGFNFGINRNKLLGYPDLEQSPYRNQYAIGQSISTTYLLNYAGIDPMTGLMTFTDYNHDGVVTVNESVYPGTRNDDRKIKIDQEPDYSGGLSSQFGYKNVSVSVTFTYLKQMGVNLLNNPASGAGLGVANIAQYVFDHAWKYQGQTDALFPRLSANPILTASMNSSNAGWSDASYVRWSNLAFSYALPGRLVKRSGLKGMSFSINGYNIMVFSPYKGLDPEVRTFGGMPPSRRITAGLHCSF